MTVQVKALNCSKDLPEEVQAQLKELLVGGATPETAADVVNESNQYRISQKVVANFFQTHPEIHFLRAQRLVKDAETILTSLGSGSTAAGEKRYVKAVIMDGLQAQKHSEKSWSVRDALRSHREVENLRLHNKILDIRRRDLENRQKHQEAHAELERERATFIRVQTNRLERLKAKIANPETLTPESLESIREIYGLVSNSLARVADPGQDTPAPPPLPQPSAEELETEIYITEPKQGSEAADLVRRACARAKRR